MEHNAESFTMRELMLVLRKHVLLFAGITLACGLAGYGVSQWGMQPQYESGATMIVNVSQSSPDGSSTYDQIAAAQQLVNTYSLLLKSDAVLTQVAQDLNLAADTAKLGGEVTVKGVDQTEVINVSVQNPDAQTAADIANDITKIAQNSLQSKVDFGSIAVVSPAKKADKPISPNIPLNTVLSLAAGCVLATLLSLLRELMSQTFSSEEDVQKYLAYPVLGVVPEVDRKEFQS